MGAAVFKIRVPRSRASTLEEAFRLETASARHEYGHSGYSGTIGDKHEVRCVPALVVAPGVSWEQVEEGADRLMEQSVRYSDKWGPCWAIEVPGAEGGWLLFGVAPE